MLQNILNSVKLFIYTLIASLFLLSCTDLKEEVLDEELGSNNATPETALAAAYNVMMSSTFVDHAYVFGLQEYSTDEAMLPTRASDWGDNGAYRTIQEFTWGSEATLVTQTWNKLTLGITKSLTAIQTISNNTSDANYKIYLAEAKAMLYFYIYHTLDLYGQAPYRSPYEDNGEITVLKSSTYIDELITNVENLIDDLSEFGDNSTYDGRFTKQAAYAFLAELYMNRAVYKDRFNESSNFNFTEASVNNSSKTDMDKVIEYTSKVIESGYFSLNQNYFDNFGVSNTDGPELIFVVPQDITDNYKGDNDFGYMCVERNQRPTPTERGTNGSCTTPEYYATWDNNHDDPRFDQKYQYSDGTWFLNDSTQKSIPVLDHVTVSGGSSVPWFHFNRGILVGQQYGPTLNSSGGDYNYDSKGNIIISTLVMDKNKQLKMNFTPELTFTSGTTLDNDHLNQGVRIFKFEFDAYYDKSTSRIDIPLFRLGGMYALRAEAYFRSGNTSGALNDINTLRTTRVKKVPTSSSTYNTVAGTKISSIDKTILYNEISYEMYWEMKRRPQMVRFGTFDNAKTGKSTASEPYRRVFPIPESVITANSGTFEQNEGY
jgi:starch-binding outer membrane protein, SusD/RagB family